MLKVRHGVHATAAGAALNVSGEHASHGAFAMPTLKAPAAHAAHSASVSPSARGLAGWNPCAHRQVVCPMSPLVSELSGHAVQLLDATASAKLSASQGAHASSPAAPLK